MPLLLANSMAISMFADSAGKIADYCVRRLSARYCFLGHPINNHLHYRAMYTCAFIFRQFPFVCMSGSRGEKQLEFCCILRHNMFVYIDHEPLMNSVKMRLKGIMNCTDNAFCVVAKVILCTKSAFLETKKINEFWIDLLATEKYV